MRDYFPGEEPFETLPKQDTRYHHLWVGVVRRYDQDNEVCDVEWITYAGGRPATHVPLALGGPRAYMGGPPEEGSLVFCAWLPHLATGNYKPVIVAYSPTGTRAGRKFELVREVKDLTNPETEKQRGTRYKMPKLYAGDLAMVSSDGSHVICDENLHIAAGGQMETFFRSADLTILTSALQHYIEAADSRVRWGMVERAHPTFVQEDDPRAEDDRILHYVTQNGDSSRLEDGGAAYVEHRLQVRETSTGDIPIPETRFKNNEVDRNWLAEVVTGTLVGENPFDSAQYGKPLVRIVLSGKDVAKSYEPASSSEETTAASAWHVNVKPGDGTLNPVGSLDLDKSGRLAIALSSTSGAHPAGENKSLQLAADGAVEASFGTGSGTMACIKVSGDSDVEVTQDYVLTVGGEADVEVTNGYTLITGGDIDIDSGGELTLAASGNATLTGALVFLGDGGGGSGGGRPF